MIKNTPRIKRLYCSNETSKWGEMWPEHGLMRFALKCELMN